MQEIESHVLLKVQGPIEMVHFQLKQHCPFYTLFVCYIYTALFTTHWKKSYTITKS